MRELVEQAIGGDEDAFARLVQLHADRLYALAYRATRDPHAAEDVVQAALVRAWTSLPQLRDPDRFEAWTYRLVVRAAVDHARSRRRRVTELALIDHDLPGGPTVADTADALASRDLVDRALARVTVEQRAILALHAWMGMGQREIADVLGVPVGTAASRLHYALKALRAAIEAEQRPVTGKEVLA